ncbi:LysR family transcriptional regulator [Corynebacterium sp.]|uniref:helix-turn-helix domain-containing protein n=1 Tax=Corynebacterium sp. TaxID=1720 RepID=UPI0026487B0C|nr:LysR family transcriptional regulator [Corynebacterium sp.]
MNSRPDSLRHWEYFLAVVEEGGMTAAADRLRVTQPPVSQAIKKLESHVGTPLIERSSSGVTPTAAGRHLPPSGSCPRQGCRRTHGGIVPALRGVGFPECRHRLLDATGHQPRADGATA